MPGSLFNLKRSKTNDDSRSGVSIFVPGGGRSSQRTKVKIPTSRSASPSSSSYSLPFLSRRVAQKDLPPIPPMPPAAFIASSYYQDTRSGITGVDEDGRKLDVNWLASKLERLKLRTKDLGASMVSHEGVFSPRPIDNFPSSGNAPTPTFTEGFSKLNDAIARFCDDAAGTILQDWPFDGTNGPTTEHVKNLVALKAVFPQGNAVPSMILSRRNAPRPLDDVINYGLRSIISKVLHEEIFDPFHPSLSPRIGGERGVRRSAYLKKMYQSMRFEDTDVDILSWRAAHFKLHGSRAGPEFQVTFIRDLSNSIIRDQIYPFLQGIFGGRMDHPPIEMESITDIVQAAFNWNRSIKCLVPPIDLRTFVVPNDAPFDAETMEYYEKPLGSLRTKIIICAGSCGLKLYEYEGSGGKAQEKVKVLKKIKVLVPQNYGDT